MNDYKNNIKITKEMNLDLSKLAVNDIVIYAIKKQGIVIKKNIARVLTVTPDKIEVKPEFSSIGWTVIFDKKTNQSINFPKSKAFIYIPTEEEITEIKNNKKREQMIQDIRIFCNCQNFQELDYKLVERIYNACFDNDKAVRL